MIFECKIKKIKILTGLMHETLQTHVPYYLVPGYFLHVSRHCNLISHSQIPQSPNFQPFSESDGSEIW